MRNYAFYSQNALFVNAALIATHINAKEDGFRPKDLKFYIELLSNWIESKFDGYALELQNTQIQRLLNQLHSEGLLDKSQKQSKPTFKFKPIGLLEIISRMVHDDSLKEMEDFLFLYHVVSMYSDKMKTLILGDRNYLPSSYRIEIEHLLDVGNLIERKIAHLEVEIRRLETRINEAQKSSRMVEKLLAKGNKLEQIVEMMEKNYPYNLNNQKSMSKLFQTLSPDVQFIEMSSGAKLRADTLWVPLLNTYRAQLKLVKNLQCN